MLEENFVELQGTVEEIVFHNSDTGFTVLEIMTEDEYITVVGVLADVAPGEELRLRGNWVNHQTFGRQFRVELYERKMPSTSAELYRYC